MLGRLLTGLKDAFDNVRSSFKEDEYTQVLQRMETMRETFGGEKGAQELPEYIRLERRCQQLERSSQTQISPSAHL